MYDAGNINCFRFSSQIGMIYNMYAMLYVRIFFCEIEGEKWDRDIDFFTKTVITVWLHCGTAERLGDDVTFSC